MIHTLVDDVSYEEFDEILNPFDQATNKYIDNTINDYIAYYIAT